MFPRTDGYYVSDRIDREEWHAGVRMAASFFRFLQFFPDGFWLWSDRSYSSFDVPAFVADFDHAGWRLEHRSRLRPTSREREGGYLFEFGTWQVREDQVTLTTYCPLAEMSRDFDLTIIANAQWLLGWNCRLVFHPLPNPSGKHEPVS